MLRDQGLNVSPGTTSDCAAGQNGTVTAQSPVGGSSVKQDTTVNITICAASQDVTVPNVIGASQSAATTTLQGQGFTVSTGTTTACTMAENGTVTAQSPVGGSPAESGSTVSITVCANRLG
jgi:serine/threonine-protein kinase